MKLIGFLESKNTVVCAIQERHIKHESEFHQLQLPEKWESLTTSADENGNSGVGFNLSSQAQQSLDKYQIISNRIIRPQFSGENRKDQKRILS